MSLGAYSLILIAVLMLALAGFLLFRKGIRPTEAAAFGLLLFGLIVAWLILRPRATPLTSPNEVTAQIGTGTPVLLEFQSPYCAGCAAIKPVVDQLEQDLQGKLNIIRIDIQSEIARELIPIYGFEYTPTFIYFDATGSEAWREAGGLSVERVYQSLGEHAP